MKDLYTVGPVNMFDRTLKVASKPIPYFRNDYFSSVYFDIQENMLKFFNAPEGSKLILLTTSGTGGMEASVKNLCNDKSNVLVINGGSFGSRFVEICQRNKVPYIECKVPFEEDLTVAMMDEVVGDKQIDTIFVNIHETSIGKLYDYKVLKEFAKKKNAMLVVDAISSFLADKNDMSEMNADVIFTGSQKALAVDAGVCLMVVTPKAIERIKNINCQDLYLGLQSYLQNGERGQTPFTPAVGTVLMIQDRLQGIKEAGIDSEFNRCIELAKYFRTHIKDLPISVPEYNLSNCLTPIIFKNDEAQEMKNYLIENYDIHITPSGGANASKLSRIGHIGNHDINSLKRLIDAMRRFYQQ